MEMINFTYEKGSRIKLREQSLKLAFGNVEYGILLR